MRAMWRVHGKPGRAAARVRRPPLYHRRCGAAPGGGEGRCCVRGGIFREYIHGRDAPDFAALVTPAGLVLRKRNAGAAWWGDVRLEARTGLVLASIPPSNSPAYRAGLDRGDEIRLVDGVRVSLPDEVTAIVRRHKPGDTLVVEYVDRTRVPKTVTVALEEDPRLELVAVESTGRPLSPAQSDFRSAWLGRKR